MLAAFLDKPESVRIRDLPEAAPLAPHEVRIRVMASGICGSDVHFFEHGKIGPFLCKEPLVLGHEASGIVEEAGGEVDTVKPGDRVALEPGTPCFQCETCKRGHYNLCPHVVFLGCPPDTHGSFRETMRHHHAMCHCLPEGIDYEEGALIEPLAVAVHACRQGNVGISNHVAVLGAGPIGLLIAQVAQASGARVAVCEILPDRLQFAREMGADLTLNPTDGGIKEAILAAWGRESDVVLEASGALEGHRMALDLAAPGGTVVFVGWSRNPEIPLNVHLIGSKELTVRGQFRYRNVFPEAIGLAHSGKVRLKPFITHRFGLSQTGEALAFARRKQAGTIKILIQPDPK